MTLRKKVSDAEVPSSTPKQQITPHENHEDGVFKRDFRPSVTVKKCRQARRRTLETDEEESDEKTADERHDVRLVHDVWKDERIGKVPDTTPDTDAGRNDDELREETVEDKWNQSIVL